MTPTISEIGVKHGLTHCKGHCRVWVSVKKPSSDQCIQKIAGSKACDLLAKPRRHMHQNCTIFLFMSIDEIILSISMVAFGSAAFVYTIWRTSSSGRQGNLGRLHQLFPDALNAI